MSRYVRKLMLSAIAVGFATAGLAAAIGGAIAGEHSVWNFNVWGGPRAFTAGIETLKAELEAAAPGQFELSINYGDALGHRKQNSENIQVGAFDGVRPCSWTGAHSRTRRRRPCATPCRRRKRRPLPP